MMASRDKLPERKASPRSHSDLLSLARRLYPRESEEQITARSDELALVSDRNYALCELSCNVCHQPKFSEYRALPILVESLNADCNFCEILRKCQQHFAEGSLAMQLYSFGLKTDIQICFPFADNGRTDTHVQLYSKESDALMSPFRYAKDVCESADSIASLSAMNEWMNRCAITHQHIPPREGCRPTRLIKLGGNDDSTLRLCSPQYPVKFAALSYRWGPGKQSETTKENVSERYNELTTSDLPRTLQDAIQVTRGLQLEYLWIDRICIVQDDDEEWAKEASLMADIYANAYVVLSATATEDSKDGFLQKKKEPLVIRYVQHGQGGYEVRARQIESHDCHREAQKNMYTLFQRGWCMQERFLARRIIHFLPDETLFECENGRECECGAASQETLILPIHQGYKIFTSLRAAPRATERFASNWMEIVRDYSHMKLTYGQDSLPALSGLAACMKHLEPGKYIAGLWEYSIVSQLGWRVDPKSNTRRWKLPENVDIIGPSFSWSSHVRNIDFYEHPPSARDMCTLESFKVYPATPNPYGQVLHASICLSGQVVLGHDMYSFLMTSDLLQTGRVYLDVGLVINSGYYMQSLHDEKWSKEKTWGSVICFGLYSYFHYYTLSKREYVDTLLLQRSETRVGEYLRIGVAQRIERSWFDKNTVARTVTLV